MKYLIVVVFGIVALGMTSCLKEKAAPIVVDVTPVDSTCLDTISFSNEILTEILTPSCNVGGCHDASASGGYNLTTHSAVSNNSAIILNTINQSSGVVAMPYGGTKLNDSLITKLECWIEQGKLNN